MGTPLGGLPTIFRRQKPIKNPDKPTKSDEKEIHFNARAKNCLFESFSLDVFNQVFTLNTAHKIWLKLQELHDGTSNVHEQKHCLAKQNYDSFTMNDNELVRDMYSYLNLIINELHSIGLLKLDDADIVRKIISVLPQKICKHHHHPSQHGGLKHPDPAHSH